MEMNNGFYDVPPGRIAAVVTHLEMLAAPNGIRDAPAPDFALVRVTQPGAEWYRALYAGIGADWLWSSRLQLAPAVLEAIIGDPGVEIHVLRKRGREIGLVELDFRVDGECELAFFGLTADAIGQGAGRQMMNAAIRLVFARPIQRFWLHTCTLDHPRALEFYRRSGFRATRQQIEIADDPRLTAVLPETAASQIPIFRP